jgi:hypothetical protein
MDPVPFAGAVPDAGRGYMLANFLEVTNSLGSFTGAVGRGA